MILCLDWRSFILNLSHYIAWPKVLHLQRGSMLQVMNNWSYTNLFFCRIILSIIISPIVILVSLHFYVTLSTKGSLVQLRYFRQYSYRSDGLLYWVRSNNSFLLLSFFKFIMYAFLLFYKSVYSCSNSLAWVFNLFKNCHLIKPCDTICAL